MMRGIAIFSFFALSTILVIVMQPGPRPAYVYEPTEVAVNAASRNEIAVLHTPEPNPTLSVPDDVAASLKSAARSGQVEAPLQSASGASTGSVERLQAVLTASLKPNASAFQAPKPVSGTLGKARDPEHGVSPELRDMSWQTLNTLNGLGQMPKGPGQEGSLLNSIVRRSMGQVAAPEVERKVERNVGATAQQSYVVEPGDTLALIAIKLFGSALETDTLLLQNPVLRQNPNSLRIGQVLHYRLR